MNASQPTTSSGASSADFSTVGLCALLVLAVSGISGGTLGPIVLNLFVRELSLSDQQGGFILAIEAAGYGVGNLLFALGAYRLRHKMLAWLALGILIVGNLATTAATNATELFMLRAICGIGMGLVGGIVFGIAASVANPQRLYALIGAAFLSGAVVVLMLGSLLAETWGLFGLFGFIASLAAIAAGATFWLPARHLSERLVVAPRDPLFPSALVAAPLLLGLLALYAGHNALWSFQARIGVMRGIADSTVGYLLGLSAIGGIAGALASFKLGLLVGYVRSQALAFVLLLVAAFSLVYGTGFISYLVCASTLKVAWFFSLPYIQGGIAHFDPQGRLVAVGAVMQTLGAAIGPATAALVVDHGFELIGWVGATYYLLGAALVFPVFVRLDRRGTMHE